MKHDRENSDALSSYYEKIGTIDTAIHVPFELPSTWAWCRLKTFCLPQFRQNPENKFGYIDIDSIDNKMHRIKQPKILQASEAPSRAQRMVFETSTVFSMVRPYLENIALVGKKSQNCIASTGFYVCTPVENSAAKSLFYFLISPFVITTINNAMKGDNSPSVRKKDMESLLLPVAPLPEQAQMVSVLDRVMPLLET